MRLIYLFIVLLLIGGVSTDRLPSGMPESQVFSIGTTLSATGITGQLTKMDWIVSSGTPWRATNSTVLTSSPLSDTVTHSWETAVPSSK
ncbi:hypothetical protein [uncultured Methanospirillum sp.]|uniref:hypothetical protein n=1 Tax=uncultured Methanospirillum sp. TaxID=262503 RepID=UPI0029C7E8CE|nr:hypothetical protein [uncultured Methanospirillum sp.]